MANASEISSEIAGSIESILGLKPVCVQEDGSLSIKVSDTFLGTEVLVHVPLRLCNNEVYLASINGVLGTYNSSHAIAEEAAKTFRRAYAANAMSL